MSARRRRLARITALVLYVLLVALLLGGLWTARQHTIRRLDSQTARAAWRDWKSAARRQNERSGTSVKRRIARTDEPPMLVLLRDHFAAVVVVSLVVVTALYVFVIVIAGGVLAGGRVDAEAAEHRHARE